MAKVDAIRHLRTQWRADTALQHALGQAFDSVGFDDAYVERCLAAAQSGRAPRKTKYIKDNVWGMIEVGWPTIRLLDCPAVQRLRGIKQLGLSYLTYPSAEHSRFIHSLGMYHVVWRFLEAADRRAQDPDKDYNYVPLSSLHPLCRDDVLHAAILHDVGHMPFSHATERVLSGFEEIFMCGSVSLADFRSDVDIELRKTKTQTVKLSEALSLLVVLSERFGRFYDGYVRVHDEEREPLVRIAALIAGVPPADHLTGVTEIISAAAVDADKIDYISRDARACGIPVGVDVSRIFLRSGFISETRDRLKHLKSDPAEREIIFIVNAAGMDTVDEITESRAALHHRVYLHAVTRTAEAVLSRTLEENARSGRGDENLKDTLHLWAMSDNALLYRVSQCTDSDVRRLARRLLDRDLPKKACVFTSSVAGMHMPLAALLGALPPGAIGDIRKKIANTPIESLTRDALEGDRGSTLEAQIVQEARHIARLLEVKHSTLVPDQSLELLVVAGSVMMDRQRKECIVLQGGELLRTTDFTNVDRQKDAFDVFKATGFVMSDPEWRPIVLIAARTVIFRLDDAITDSSLPTSRGGLEQPIRQISRCILDLWGVARRTGVPRSQLEELVSALIEVGYFDELPLLATPVNPESSFPRATADRVSQFDGQFSWRVRSETVAAFLNQIPLRLRDDMESALEHLIFFDRATVTTALMHVLRGLRIEQSAELHIVGLSPNSGQHVRELLRQETDRKSEWSHVHFHNSLRPALARNGPIVLVDDNVSSATQARAQFLAWAGVTRNTWPAACQDEDGIYDEKLSNEEMSAFRDRSIWLGTCVGRPSAEANLRTVLQTLNFKDFKGVRYQQEIGQAENISGELRKYLSEVGMHLLADTRYGKEPSALTAEERTDCERDVLGYGNVCGMVATAMNVPTATVTAIWLPGLYNGSPWMPLMIRRNKLRHLVIG